MRALALTLLLAASPALAQQAPPPQPPPSQPTTQLPSAPQEDCGCGVPNSPRGPR